MQTQSAGNAEFVRLNPHDEAKIVIEVSQTREWRILGNLLEKQHENLLPAHGEFRGSHRDQRYQAGDGERRRHPCRRSRSRVGHSGQRSQHTSATVGDSDWIRPGAIAGDVALLHQQSGRAQCHRRIRVRGCFTLSIATEPAEPGNRADTGESRPYPPRAWPQFSMGYSILVPYLSCMRAWRCSRGRNKSAWDFQRRLHFFFCSGKPS